MFPVINLGPLSLPAPALLLLIGFMAGIYLAGKKAASYSIDPDLIDRTLWIGTISALIGSRLSYIASSPAAFRGNIKSVISLNPALLDPIGGLVLGIAVIFLILSKQKIDIWRYLDSLTPFLSTVILAYFLSCFASGSGFGTETDLPWGIYLWGAVRHPVQLYLSGFSLLTLLMLQNYGPFKNLPAGSTFLTSASATTIYMLLLTIFQEPGMLLLVGIRQDQFGYWVFLFIMLALLNYRIHSTALKVDYEAEK
jgi:phosphatidylglycerol:prolipoprotein diacylglycerol transferase